MVCRYCIILFESYKTFFGIFYKQKIFQIIVNVKLENEMLVSELTCLYIHLTTLEKWNH